VLTGTSEGDVDTRRHGLEVLAFESVCFEICFWFLNTEVVRVGVGVDRKKRGPDRYFARVDVTPTRTSFQVVYRQAVE
jgi:hypothetical protein